MAAGNNLKAQAGKSAIWQLSGGGWQAFVRLGASTILARELTPTEFGIFAIALIIQELVTYMGSFGMGTGVVAKKDVSQIELSTCFWTMACIRTAMFLLCISLAPFAALYFNEPKVELVVYAISLTFLFQIPEVIAQAIMVKQLKFAKLNIIRGFTIFVESTIAIILVLNTDLSYWSLVIAMLVNSILTSFLIFYSAKWVPSIEFDKESFKFYSRFGLNGLGFSIMNYFSQNADYLVVGRILGVKGLGLYEFAYKIPHLVIDKISRPISAVAFPALSKVQEDKSKLIAGFNIAVSVVVSISFPILAGLISLSDVFVLTLWGEQWHEIIVPMQILSICAMIKCISLPSVSVLYCVNRPDMPFKFSILTVCITFLSVFYLGLNYGLNGVALAMLLSTFPGILQVFWMYRFIKGKMKPLLLNIAAFFTAALICGTTSFILKNHLLNQGAGNILTIILSSISGALVYLVCMLTMFKKQFLELLDLVEQTTGKNIKKRIKGLS